MLDIYKASAGSGKTFALTLEYFRIIFTAPIEYRNVLAVTFTNKATEEMKSRIINELHRLAEGEESEYGKILKQELQLNGDQLKNKASLLRTMLLHDYGRLAVTTIDRFFQRILKAFTRELGIFPGYNVELDNVFVLQKAVDKVMQQVKDNPELRSWISDLMNSNVEDGKSWSVKSKIAELGEELFKENYMLLDEQVVKKFEDKHFLKNFRDFLHTVTKEFEEQLTGIADSALQVIRQAGLELSDFKSGKTGCASWFYKLKAGNFDAPSATVRKGGEDPEMWVTKTSSRKSDIEAVRGELMRFLQQALEGFDRKNAAYLSARQLAGNLYQLGILHDLYGEVRNYCDEKGVMLLSDTTHILNLLIAGNDTSFLFEKCGNYYKHLMIDEFQDTSSMQWKNFKPLMVNSLGEGAKAMIVGDVKQSIYRWRNGDWGLLAKGVEEQFRHLGVNQVVLKDNWRSAKDIVEFNNDFFETAAAALSRLYLSEAGEDDKRADMILEAYRELRQTPRRQKTAYVEVSFGPEKREEGSNLAIMEEVVTTINDILERGGKQKDIVILVRDGKEGAFVADYFMEYNKTAAQPVNFISNDSLYVWSSPYVQFIVAVLRYLAEPYDKVNKAVILYFYRIFIRDEENPRLHALFRQTEEEDLFALLSVDFHIENDIALSYSLYETIERIIDRLALKDKTQEVPYLIAFQDIVYEYETNNSNSITLFLEWWEKEQGKRVLSTSEEMDAVKILTIHKSKGLEFECVILPFCTWELDSVRPVRCIWCGNDEPGFNALDYVPLNYSSKLADTIFREDYFDEHLKAYIDNLNLLYVALTRAKTELYLLPYHPKQNKDGSTSLGDIGAFVWQVLEEMGGKSGEETSFRYGKKLPFAATESARHVPLSLSDYPVWNPGERISVKYRYQDYTEPADEELSAIDEGKLLHEIFKSVKYAGDVEQAVQRAYIGGLIQFRERADFCAKIAGFIDTPEASAWFSPEYEVINEKDLLFPDGKKARPDRVMIAPDGKVLVIDYKFGQNVKSEYLKQVRYYCNTLKKMGYARVEGFVWYVKMGRIESVG